MKPKRFLKLASLYFLAPLLLLVIGATAASWALIGSFKSVNDNVNWFGSPNGIDVKEYVEIGGLEQLIRIRGRDRDNPVMLDLHGGSGGGHMILSHRSLRPLTEYFTLVEWDQRGAGMSKGEDNFAEVMTYERMVDDAIEVIEHLKDRLGVEKVILVGHSWGSAMGLGVVKKRPDLIAAFVGVGMDLAWLGGFDESARLVLERARLEGDQETIDTLQALPAQWPPKDDQEATMRRIETIQGLQVGSGNFLFHAQKEPAVTSSEILMDAVLSPDFSILESVLYFKPSKATAALQEDLYDYDFRTELDYEVPMFVFQGEHDWQTATSLAKPWFAALRAPYKQYVAFEVSSHLVWPDEPGKYLYEMVKQVRPFAVH